MNVLCVVSSKHGSTMEVGQTIVEELNTLGVPTVLKSPSQVESIAEYDTVIVGSAVYMAQWMEEARSFVQRYIEEMRSKKVWAFSVGLSGMEKGMVQDPERALNVIEVLKPIEHQTFSGRMEPENLSMRERSVARMGGAIPGDFRDLAAVRTWARRLGSKIQS